MKADSMAKRIRIGVIGAGGIAQIEHLPNLLRLKPLRPKLLQLKLPPMPLLQLPMLQLRLKLLLMANRLLVDLSPPRSNLT